MTVLYDVKLNSDEIVLLDGKCRPEIQVTVDRAKIASQISGESDIPEGVAGMIAKVIDEAKANGKLMHRIEMISVCPACKRSDGYHVHKRSTKYRRKGDTDYDNPKLFMAHNLAHRFVTIKNHISVGFCVSCFDQAFPVLQKHLKTVNAQVPDSLLGEPCKWKWNKNRKCKACGWEGHEGEMGMERTLMGDGWYPAKCPSCKAENHLFHTAVEIRDGFTLTEVTREEVRKSEPTEVNQ